MDHITAELKIISISTAQDKVEIVRRSSASGNYYFVLNHSGETVRYAPNPAWKAVLGTNTLEPYGIAVYCENNLRI